MVSRLQSVGRQSISKLRRAGASSQSQKQSISFQSAPKDRPEVSKSLFFKKFMKGVACAGLFVGGVLGLSKLHINLPKEVGTFKKTIVGAINKSSEYAGKLIDRIKNFIKPLPGKNPVVDVDGDVFYDCL